MKGTLRRAIAASAVIMGITASLAMSAMPAFAEYPDRPITIVVPFSPGSGTDTGTRVMSTFLEQSLKKPIIVDNRPGGNGSLGAGIVAAATPDGYTLLMGTNSTQSANALLIRNLSYNAEKDFIPIGMIATFEGLLVVNKKMDVKTTDDLVAYIKAHPGEVTYATGNVTSLVMASMFVNHLGLDALRIPFKSNPEALIDVVSGQVDMMFPDIASSAGQVKSGTVTPLASVTLGDVTPLAPNLVPLSKTLVPDLKLVGWIGLFAPKGTPDAVVQKLSAAVDQAVKEQGFKEKLASIGANASFLPPDELNGYIAKERVNFAKIFKDAGMEPQ
jgi:tripartite-type tricarboxylate transporter receptor subunit TctC